MRFLILRRVNLFNIRCKIHSLRSRIRPTIIMAFLFVLYLTYRILTFPGDRSNRNASLSGWGREQPLSIGEYLDPTKNTATVVPRNFCQTKAFLVIMVCSSVYNFERRRAIRITWGNTTDFNYPVFAKLHGNSKGQYLEILPERRKLYAEYLSGQGETMTASVRLVFVLGRGKLSSLRENEAVAKEAMEYNDIIQENFIDTYNNLTIKTIMALKHINKSCVNTTAYVFKCDDDTFVVVPNLLHFLLGGTVPIYNATLPYYDRNTGLVMSPRNRLVATRQVLLGHQFCNVPPISSRRNKWYVPSYMFRGQVYPRYLCGSGYLMTIDVVPLLYKASLGTKIMHLEDVFITGVCAEKAGIKRYHQPLFQPGYSSEMCSFKGTVTQHHAKGSLMWESWYMVTNYRNHCLPPSADFKAKLPESEVC